MAKEHKIYGVNSLNQTEYSVMADRIERALCVAATLTKGNLKLRIWILKLLKQN